MITELWCEQRALCGRWVTRRRREPISLVALVAQPMVWLLLFSHLFATMASAAAVPDYLRFMTAGAVAMTTFNACIAGGVELLFDLHVPGLLTPQPRPVFPITTFAGLPLTFASTALVPLALMPGWMRDSARVNPLTLATDELRSLITAGWHPVEHAARCRVEAEHVALSRAASSRNAWGTRPRALRRLVIRCWRCRCRWFRRSGSGRAGTAGPSTR